MKLRLPSVLLLALLLPACTLAPPLPQAEWDVPSDPLYPPAVWIENDDLGSGGGVIVASTPELGTIVLTAHHVIRDAEPVTVGVFRHSRVDGSGPEYVRYPAEVVVAGFVLDERLVHPIRELAAAYESILDAADAPGRFPGFEAQLVILNDSVRWIEAAGDVKELVAGLDRLREGLVAQRDGFRAEFGAIMKLVSEKLPAEEGARRGQRIAQAIADLVDAMARFGSGSISGHDVALLRIRTEVPHHSARCLFPKSGDLDGAEGKIVTIRPDGQPRVRSVVIHEDLGALGSSRLTGSFRSGNSGSPIFVDGRFVGILTDGLYSEDEEPGDRFDDGVFLQARTIRDWLARRGLEDVLR